MQQQSKNKQSVKIYAEQYRDDIKIVWCCALKRNNVASADTVLWRRFGDQQSQSFGEYNNYQIREHVFYFYNFNLG